MKQSALIKGLIVFSISDGKEVGRVKDILINAKKKAVDYLIVDNPSWILGTYVIAFSDIVGIGDDAVMIENEEAIKKMDDVPEALALLKAGIKLIDTKVLTKKGNIIGTVTELIVDENSGQVSACEYNNTDNKKTLIPALQIFTFGKDVLVVNIVTDTKTDAAAAPQAVEEELSGEQPLSAAGPQDNTEEIVSTGFEPLGQAANTSEPATEDSKSVARDKAEEENTAELETLTAAQLFAQKQKEYLIGKTASKTITDGEGNVLVNKGDVITGEMVDKVTQAGKFRELVLNV